MPQEQPKKSQKDKTIIITVFCFFFNFMATPVTYGSFQARDGKGGIQAAAFSNAGSLTHCVRPGIEPLPPQQPEPLQPGS